MFEADDVSEAQSDSSKVAQIAVHVALAGDLENRVFESLEHILGLDRLLKIGTHLKENAFEYFTLLNKLSSGRRIKFEVVWERYRDDPKDILLRHNSTAFVRQ